MKRNNVSKVFVIGLAVLGISIASGCAIKDTVSHRFPAVQDRIEIAKTAEADKYAPVPLQSAEDKLKSAKDAVRSHNMVSADLLVDEAMADADYAAALAPTQKAKEEAMILSQSIEDVRKKIQQMPAVN